MQINKEQKNILKEPNVLVKFTDMNHIKEIMYIKHKTKEMPIVKLNENEYALKKTGEIFQCSHIDNRSENTESLRQTFKRIRNIINYNFTGEENELMLTLTYAKNMTDRDVLMVDFEVFIKRLKRYAIKTLKSVEIEYMSVVEPQERGAWHCHVLIKFLDLPKVYIANSKINALWGQGFVTVRSMKTKGVDNIGAYLSAYLGDVELTKETKHLSTGHVVKEIEIDGKKKKFIKGGRLHMYPPKMNIYRKSRGIKTPTSEWITYAEAQQKIGKHEPTYCSTIEIQESLDGNLRTLNTINYEFFNLKRS